MTLAVLQPDGAEGIDASISPSGSQIGEFLTMGNVRIVSDAIYRTLVRFNLSAFVAAGAFNAAMLVLSNADPGGTFTGPKQWFLYRCTRNWVESLADWPTYDGVNAWSTAGGDYDPALVATATLTNPASDLAFDVTELANEALTVYGGILDLIIIGPEIGGSNQFFQAYSSDHMVAAKRPRLELNHPTFAAGGGSLSDAFNASRKANFYGTLLSHFAEWVTLKHDGEPDRQLRCVFRRKAADRRTAYIDENVDTGDLRVGRDVSHALGGIDHPRHGDKILRDPAKDVGGLYAWNGEILQETPHSFVLRYTRPKLTGVGSIRG